ncbi:MAG: hypothetical protein H6Q90_2998 [Deltaproteobacteria bacterium]|nr:hypothetical protein [Deltaproteobacteria bacterium]
MQIFVRAVVTGFALSLGAAIFKKVQPHLGLAEKDKEKKPDDAEVVAQEAAGDPDLQMS